MEIKKCVLEYEGKNIPYILHIKKVKNLNLKISEKGELIITCNAYIPMSKIEAFVKEKIDWILKKQAKQINRAERYYSDGLRQNKFYLYDKELLLVRIQSNKNYIRFDEEKLYVYYIQESDIPKTMIKFIHRQCENDFSEAVAYYYEKMKEYRFPFPTI